MITINAVESKLIYDESSDYLIVILQMNPNVVSCYLTFQNKVSHIIITLLIRFQLHLFYLTIQSSACFNVSRKLKNL